MAFVALKPLEFPTGIRPVGELVPEAAQWPNLRAWINQGHVARVEDSSVKEFQAALRKPGADGAGYLAPTSKPHHIAAAARKLQLDAEGRSGRSLPPPSEPTSASAAPEGDGETETVEPQPAAKATRPARKRR